MPMRLVCYEILRHGGRGERIDMVCGAVQALRAWLESDPAAQSGWLGRCRLRGMVITSSTFAGRSSRGR